MKIFISILWVFTFILISCTNMKPNNPANIISHDIIFKVSKLLNEKYGLKLVGIGGGIDKEGVWNLHGSYNRYGPKILEKEHARKLIFNCVHEFLKETNSNEKFRPYMKNYPFTQKNLTIAICNFDENGKNVHFPFISDISMTKDTIDYMSLGPTLMDPYAQIITETYEEALKLSGKMETILKSHCSGSCKSLSSPVQDRG